MLQIADKKRKAEENKVKADNKAKKDHLTKHKTLLEDEDLADQCKIMSLIMIKGDKEQTKMSREPPLSGPYIVMWINIQTKLELVMELTSGVVYHISYRTIKDTFPIQHCFLHQCILAGRAKQTNSLPKGNQQSLTNTS